ncbi:MAG: class I SAM-dependent methyltransferase [Verrucomicrobiia bacterium]
MTTSHPTIQTEPELGQCRLCGEPLRRTFVNLGMSPLCESYVSAEQLNHMEPFYPLHAFVCEKCLLVQVGDYVTADHIYSEYAYFSSYSDSWLRHAREYVDMITERFRLGPQHFVIELASNDGYLLQNFVNKSISVLGIDPAANIAPHAIKRGVPTLVRFFGVETARELLAQGKQADLLIGNNVLPHVPALNDFVAGMKLLLKPGGVITMEFPHLWRLIESNQFDTIYHEHFSYFSFLTAEKAFARHGLTMFDVEELTTHGGSLRIYARHANDDSKVTTARVAELRRREQELGFESLDTYNAFEGQVKETKRKLLEFLIATRRAGKSVAGYGAAGKGNTLLNYCGIRTDFLDYTVDRNPYKQGKFLPGTHIPIYAPEEIAQTRPDFVLILPWNLKDEIVKQLAYIRDWGGKFVVPIPQVEII